MSKPFDVGGYYVVEYQGKWHKFPTEQEAYEFYNEKKNDSD